MIGKTRWAGPPLLIQILALIVGALVVAQLVTLLLTLVLPPEPPRHYELSDIAATLRGETPADARPLTRATQAGPPDLSGGGWLVSQRARADLARMLGVAEDRVVLGFYTALPVGGQQQGTGAPRLPLDAAPVASPVIGLIGSVPVLGLVQGPPGRGGGPPPGGGMPGGGFPGGGGVPGTRPGSDGRGGPQGDRRGDQRGQSPDRGGREQRVPGGDQPRGGASRGERIPIPLDEPVRRPTPVILDADPLPSRAARIPIPLTPIVPVPAPEPTPAATRAPDARPAAPPSVAPAPAAAPVRSAAPAVLRPEPQAQPSSRPIPVERPQFGLFGLAPAPFVEGDFVAGVRGDDGRWIVVAPQAEGFPNSWQRRVLLWFALSLLIVAPLAWGFARRIVRPLNGFADAAETLGRDPAAAILPLDGPAEVGRAAHAFNLMQSRLRSFVDDRTAMVGAISHDLRTPLTRLRFRVEDVADEQRDDLLLEIEEMEAMITSVITFIRDASTPNARERLDLATLVDDVVEDAVMVGGDVRTVSVEPAPVDVDALGMRRVLDNLLANAVKYGGRARVALHVSDAKAIADIVDDGPGIPDDELERVFEPFYRTEAARESSREGHGLGLAVCRSIARAHGGDVALFRSPEGFTARVSLPLAYEAERRAA